MIDAAKSTPHPKKTTNAATGSGEKQPAVAFVYDPLFLDGSGTVAYPSWMAMLPTGITSLWKIRKRDYVDKTDHARRLVEGGDY